MDANPVTVAKKWLPSFSDLVSLAIGLLIVNLILEFVPAGVTAFFRRPYSTIKAMFTSNSGGGN